MKRILTAVGTALLACTTTGAPAFETDAVLDQFPAAASPNVRSIQQARRGATTEERRAVREGHDGWHPTPRYRSHGSFIEVGAFGGSVERGAFYGTAGTAHSGGGIVVINNGADLASLPAALHSVLGSGAKILDIEADRLDRRPYGPDGLDVVHVGGAKIIRISPDFGRARTGDEVAAYEPPPTPMAYVPPATVYPDTDMSERPVDPPAAERRASVQAPAVETSEPDVQAPPAPPSESEAEAPPAEARQAEVQAPAPPTAPPPAAAPAAHFEPWTPDWLRDCVARYPSFDASLGTYLNDSGQRRFCTGER